MKPAQVKPHTGSVDQKQPEASDRQVDVNITVATSSMKEPVATSSPYFEQPKRARRTTKTKNVKSTSTNFVMSTQCHTTVDLQLCVSMQDSDSTESISLSQKLSKSPRKFGIGRGSPSKRLSKHSPLRFFRQPPLTSFFKTKGPCRNLFNGVQKEPKPTTFPKNTERNTNRDMPNKNAADENDTDKTSNEETSLDGTSGQELPDSTSASEIIHLSHSSPFAATDLALDEATMQPSGDLYADALVRLLAPILRHSHTTPLLSSEEWHTIVKYLLLSPPTRKALTRLLARQPGWHRLSAFERYGSVEELQQLFIAAEENGFVCLDCSSEDPSILLPMLKLPELKSLCSEFNITPITKPKPQLISSLLRLQTEQTSMTGRPVPLGSRTARALGPCVKASENLRSLLSRLFLIASLGCAFAPEDRELPSMVFRLTNVETGRVMYPTYKIERSTVIFPTREQFLRYETAVELQTESMAAIEKKDLVAARNVIAVVENNFKELLLDSQFSDHVKELPPFLRHFTPGTVYARCLQYGAEVYRKSGKEYYKSAVQALELVLSQKIYRTDRRGKCFVALALLLHKHIRDNQAAAEAVMRGLSEPVPACSTAAEQLSLVRRAVTLAECRSRALPADTIRRLRLAILTPEPVNKVPESVVKARQLDGRQGYKGIYVRDDPDSNEKHFSSVEEIAIAHYKTLGYTEGLHCEGSVVTSLFSLLFWDILYDTTVPDTFLSPYQVAPLDLGTESFYNSRRDSVEQRLSEIKEWDAPHLQQFIGQRYEEHKDKLCLVNWNNFYNVNKLTGLVRCFGGNLLACICERLAKNYYCCRRGFPDLVLWRPDSGKCKLVEVKGPNDRLSPDQEIWLDFLFRAGADTEVCRVETTGSKKPRKKTIIHDEDTAQEELDEEIL